jgi:glycosyltransferase involved in cell wall biosynthesis
MQGAPMKVAFYAPLNAPDAQAPSGDRLIARMLLRALGDAGVDVQVASRLRSLDMAGDRERQQRIARIGGAQAQRLLRRYGGPGAWRPDLWLTYHLYHKAPDWIGPAVATALGIPYAVGEAMFAKKHAAGPWAEGLAAVARALRRADLVLGLKPGDEGAVRKHLRADAAYEAITPFLDTAPFARAHARRLELRRELAARHGLDAASPWLLAVGMMREGSKLASYRALGDALARLGDRRFQVLAAGDGPARGDVEHALRGAGARARLLGCVEGDALVGLYAASDLFVWPAIKEPIGMVFLEAQAAGLPSVAGDRPGVGSVVERDRTALLPPEGDVAAFAAAVSTQLDDPARRAAMSSNALAFARDRHNVRTAGAAFAARLLAFAAARLPKRE